LASTISTDDLNTSTDAVENPSTSLTELTTIVTTTSSEDNSSKTTKIDEIGSTISSTSESTETTQDPIIAEILNGTSTVTPFSTGTATATANTILEESNHEVKETKVVAYIVVGSIFVILIASIIIYFVIKISKRRPIDNMSVEMHNNIYKNSTYVDEI
jgi:hypothetical protein